MPTCFKPAERHGKRVVYQSQDRNQPGREIIGGIVVIVFFFGFVAASHWFSHR
jgi:hypothetical protein